MRQSFGPVKRMSRKVVEDAATNEEETKGNATVDSVSEDSLEQLDQASDVLEPSMNPGAKPDAGDLSTPGDLVEFEQFIAGLGDDLANLQADDGSSDSSCHEQIIKFRSKKKTKVRRRPGATDARAVEVKAARDTVASKIRASVNSDRKNFLELREQTNKLTTTIKRRRDNTALKNEFKDLLNLPEPVTAKTTTVSPLTRKINPVSPKSKLQMLQPILKDKPSSHFWKQDSQQLLAGFGTVKELPDRERQPSLSEF